MACAAVNATYSDHNSGLEIAQKSGPITFVHRGPLIDEITEKLSAPAKVVLVGPGGVG